MKAMMIAASGMLLCLQAAAEVAELPAVKAGDSWIYRQTTERGQSWNQTRDESTVTRVTAANIYLANRKAGSTEVPRETYVGRDWSRMRDIGGKETVINRPLEFPLEIGHKWEINYQEQNPNPQHRLEKIHQTFTVIGIEDVDVPAGHFKAWKVEVDGRWEAEVAPSKSVQQGAQVNAEGVVTSSQVSNTGEKLVSGKLYRAFWYAPEVKRYVKSIEEYYSAAGVRNERFTSELESFKPSVE